MGLDMYVYAIKKLDDAEIKAAMRFKTMQEFSDAGYTFLHFPLETADAEISSDMYKNLLCCASEFTVNAEGITQKKLDEYIKQNGFPNDCFISYIADDLVISSYSENTTDKCIISHEEQKKLYTSWKEKILVFKMEEVVYWRKAYHIADFFEDSIDSRVENCGFYEIDKDTLLETIRMDEPSMLLNRDYFVNPFSRNDALRINLDSDEKLFYHLWY